MIFPKKPSPQTSLFSQAGELMLASALQREGILCSEL